MATTYADVMSGARDSITVRRVFGDPIERGDTTLVPAAFVMGGAGGGEGGEGEAQGTGTGFGVRARPVGAYVMRGDQVTWQPAFDIMRVIMSGLVFAGLATWMVTRTMNKRMAKPKMKTKTMPPHTTLIE